MDDSKRSGLTLALERLDRGLDRLEAAAMRRAESQRSAGAVQQAMALLREDRARLAADLDAALARVAALEETCAGSIRRIDHAMTAVRGIIQRSGRAEA